MPKVQLSEKGRYSITIPVHIAEAMGLEKGDHMIFRWTGSGWELKINPVLHKSDGTHQ